MNLRSARRLAAAAMAFVLLSAGDCGGLSFSDIVTGHSAQITAKNNSNQTVIVLLYADDASNTGPVITHGSPTVTTHIDGAYHLVVIGQGLPTTDYVSKLADLRSATEALYNAQKAGNDAAVGPLVDRITHANAVLDGLRNSTLALASCVGTIKFPSELPPSPRPIELEASFTNAGGAWSASCPSS